MSVHVTKDRDHSANDRHSFSQSVSLNRSLSLIIKSWGVAATASIIQSLSYRRRVISITA